MPAEVQEHAGQVARLHAGGNEAAIKRGKLPASAIERLTQRNSAIEVVRQGVRDLDYVSWGGSLGLEMLLLVAAMFLLLSAQVVGGVLAQVVGGDPTPFSLSALIFAIVVASAQAVFTVLTSLMIARVYVQLSGGGSVEVSVPSSGT